MKRLALALAVAVAVVGALEIALRALGYSAPQWYRLDPLLGWTLHAHRHGWYAHAGGRTTVDINPAGLRDREHFFDKPDDVYRIAVLGDEFSEAMAIRIDDTWWRRLPYALQACGFARGRRLEVLNFAVRGYGTAQELLTLQTAAMLYAPDLVLLQFSPNDVAENSFSLAADKARPFYFLDARGAPRLDASFAATPAFARFMQTRYQLGAEILDHSRAFQLARQLAARTFVGAAYARGDVAALQEPKNALWQDAWRVTEALVLGARDYAVRNGARFALVAAPDPLQRGMAYPDQRLATFSAKAGIPFIALSSPEHAAAARGVALRLCASLSRDAPDGGAAQDR